MVVFAVWLFVEELPPNAGLPRGSRAAAPLPPQHHTTRDAVPNKELSRLLSRISSRTSSSRSWKEMLAALRSSAEPGSQATLAGAATLRPASTSTALGEGGEPWPEASRLLSPRTEGLKIAENADEREKERSGPTKIRFTATSVPRKRAATTSPAESSAANRRQSLRRRPRQRKALTLGALSENPFWLVEFQLVLLQDPAIVGQVPLVLDVHQHGQ